jgi:hypothetical protein
MSYKLVWSLSCYEPTHTGRDSESEVTGTPLMVSLGTRFRRPGGFTGRTPNGKVAGDLGHDPWAISEPGEKTRTII